MTPYDAERERHSETKRTLAAARRERAGLLRRIRSLEEENEALRNQVAMLALSAGGGAVL